MRVRRGRKFGLKNFSQETIEVKEVSVQSVYSCPAAEEEASVKEAA